MNFCALSAISFARFCVIFFCIKLEVLRKTGSFAQNVNFYAEHIFANWPKFTGSAQNQTTEGLFKNLHTNKFKLWFCLLLVTKSSNEGQKLLKQK